MFDHSNVLKVVDIICGNKKNQSIIFEEFSTNLKEAIQKNVLPKVQFVYSFYQIT